MPVFTANVPAILKVGDKIEIGGKIKENARKMSVNLCAQEGEEPRDVVLHFDVRFHRDNIISLSRKNGVWIGSGNYDTNYNMFVPGTIFRIVFEIKDTDVITIYCQGKFHSNFLPKIPLSMARYIVAWADVERITHCYFHFGSKALGDDPGPGPPYGPASPRAVPSPPIGGDGKRWASRSNMVEVREALHRPSPGGARSIINSPRMHKKLTAEDIAERSSNESSDEEAPGKMRAKGEGRADRFFYETLMCQQPDPGFGSPDRRRDVARCRAEYNRKYNRDMSDTEKNDSEDYTEEAASKIDSSVAESEEVLPEVKRNRRGKFAPFAQVVSFMGKNARRN